MTKGEIDKAFDKEFLKHIEAYKELAK